MSFPAGSDALKLLRYYWMQVKSILLTPRQFFDTMSPTGGYIEPLVFMSVTAAVFALLQAIGRFNPTLFAFLFISIIAKTAFGAAVAHMALRALGGKSSYESTFRVFAFSKAILLFSWISVGQLPIGYIIGFSYGVFLNVIGCAKVHEISRAKAAAVLVAIALVSVVISVKLHF